MVSLSLSLSLSSLSLSLSLSLFRPPSSLSLSPAAVWLSSTQQALVPWKVSARGLSASPILPSYQFDSDWPSVEQPLPPALAVEMTQKPEN